MKFVIDMMGGDNGVETTIGAVKEFLKLHDDVYFYCVGNVECLSPLEGLDRVTIVPSTEVLKMDVDPMEAMHKKDSSLNIACLFQNPPLPRFYNMVFHLNPFQ